MRTYASRRLVRGTGLAPLGVHTHFRTTQDNTSLAKVLYLRSHAGAGQQFLRTVAFSARSSPFSHVTRIKRTELVFCALYWCAGRDLLRSVFTHTSAQHRITHPSHKVLYLRSHAGAGQRFLWTVVFSARSSPFSHVTRIKRTELVFCALYWCAGRDLNPHERIVH